MSEKIILTDNSIKVAREVVGDYGEYRGVLCPECGIRQFPKSKAGELEICVTCGNDFYVPDLPWLR